MSQTFVERELRSPSTAVHPTITDPGVSVARTTTDNGQCAFSVVTYVDADNAFGGTVRQRFIVLLAPEGESSTWTPLSVTRL